MPKLVFDKAGEHDFETGVSKGVLFVKKADGSGYENGVVWNGLTAVTESPEGAEETVLYADNIKYLSLRSAEDFKATIEAYTYPDEFGVCDGSASLVPGVKIGQQKRRSFAFCYQTIKGNDNDPEAGRVIHIIYGCTCAPSEKAYATVNESPEAITFSWEISSVPVEVTGHKSTSHIEIDSTKVGEAGQAGFEALEKALYGGDAEGEVSKLLLPDAIAALFAPSPTPTQE